MIATLLFIYRLEYTIRFVCRMKLQKYHPQGRLFYDL